MADSRSTLARIAESLGVSKMTVSRALRGERHVRPGLAARIRQAAADLGYSPDPELSRLMTHLRASRSAPSRQTLALVWNDPAALHARGNWTRLLISGLSLRAAELGYDLESFEIGSNGLSAPRLARILSHRGIQGLLIAPVLSRARDHLRLPWEKFSTVVIGLGHVSPALHRVHHHHFQGMVSALDHLCRTGATRIGFCSTSVLDQRMFSAWSAAFLARHPLGPAAAAPLLHLPRDLQRAPFLDWCRASRPEIILESGRHLPPWLDDIPFTVKPRLATLNWSPDQPSIPGLDQRPAAIGRAAIDLLAAQLHQNERGIPDCPKTLMIHGLWQPGLNPLPAPASPLKSPAPCPPPPPPSPAPRTPPHPSPSRSVPAAPSKPRPPETPAPC